MQNCFLISKTSVGEGGDTKDASNKASKLHIRAKEASALPRNFPPTNVKK